MKNVQTLNTDHKRTGSQSPIRENDPNVTQKRASDPSSSVWVNASAGTGKTKVLVDRILRLLLPRGDGRAGTEIYKILCLTFTKAAANEMLIRIQDTLGRWSILEEGDIHAKDTLRYELKLILGRSPNKNDVICARQLFAKILDEPGGLQIMTIHAFCQSLLGRFPLESGIMPFFKPLEEHDQREFLNQAITKTLKDVRQDKTSDLHRAYYALSKIVSDEQLSDLIQGILSERSQLGDLRQKLFAPEAFFEAISQKYGFSPSDTPEKLIEAYLSNSFKEDIVKETAISLANSKKVSDQNNAAKLEKFLQHSRRERIDHFEAYSGIFISDKGHIRARLVTKDLANEYPDVMDFMEEEAERVHTLINKVNTVKSVTYTYFLFLIAFKVYDYYTELKQEKAALDFDDLIIKAMDLLKKENMGWVNYKLDQSIDHVLIDEAQDTNPEQWKIVRKICDEFYSGATKEEVDRTLFVVGDHKQSIYSFQRASPEAFNQMHAYFSKKIRQADQKFEDVFLNVSFRTIQLVLDIVDQVFAGLRTGQDEEIKHHSYRHGQAGHVEIWPIFETEEPPKREPWQLPITIRDHETGDAKLARHIARTIRGWLDEPLFLPSRNRVIKPSDIMILVRTRTAFFERLTRAIRLAGVPVNGTDRIVLENQIAVHDLIAAAEFALMPEDDYTLACLLKSPLIGVSEEELFSFCHNRPGSLWQRVKEKGADTLVRYLQGVIDSALRNDVYSFFNALLVLPCPYKGYSGLKAFRERLGQDVSDPIEEFLRKAMEYAQHDGLHLQHFVHKMKTDKTDIKRIQAEGQDTVQVMTIHGAKGLQAPIVILPDTIMTSLSAGSKSTDRILWPDKTGEEFPLWSPRKEYEFEQYTALREGIADESYTEYERLLYVAMTRAEDHLYVGGYTSRKKPHEKSWYFQIESAVSSHPYVTKGENDVLFISSPQTKEPDRASSEFGVVKAEDINLPDYMSKPVQKEFSAGQALAPSKLMQDIATSPLETTKNYRFRRGNLTHKLLEMLPDIESSRRKDVAQRYLSHYAADLSQDIQESIAEETLNILDHPEFSALFGPGSLAEVPVTGRLNNGQAIHGQIDRLLIRDDSIWIVDYKTNRPPPKNPEDVPVLYKNQLRAYKEILREIYPSRTFHCALLWTDGPQLMPIALESD